MTVSSPKVLIAPAAFKGTLGPAAVARAMAAAVRAVWPGAAIIERPLSDGGNGLLEASELLWGGVLEAHEVTGPLGGRVRALLLRSGRRATIESAEACGLHLVREGKRDPLRASTRGVGELILAAVRGGAEEIVLGLGGSATVDGGTGMARALGWRFLGPGGRPIAEGGGGLGDLERLERGGQVPDVPVVALCDVRNPLLGMEGAARTFGPQKGADRAAVARLEVALERLARVVEADLGLELATLPGGGAAGGLGAGARAFLGARLESGADWMIQRAGLGRALDDVTLVLTGEGRFDAQSLMGKLTGQVIQEARSRGAQVLLVCGRLEGPVPAGVNAVVGGRVLDEEEVSRLTATACRALAGGDRLGGP